MKLRHCSNQHSKVYTLKSLCSECSQQTQDAHYKFIKMKSIKETLEIKSS